jgi:hypothetical protein
MNWMSHRYVRRVALLLLLILPAYAEGSLIGIKQTWVFMLSAGGLTLGTPQSTESESLSFKNRSWSLPVNCDVSGLKQFSTKPTMVNSGMVWADTDVSIEKDRIYLTIEATVPNSFGKSTTTCGPASLGKLKAGQYRVYYRDPDGTDHFIQSIDLKP